MVLSFESHPFRIIGELLVIPEADCLVEPPMRAYRREIGIVWHLRLVSVRPQAESVLAWLKQIAA